MKRRVYPRKLLVGSGAYHDDIPRAVRPTLRVPYTPLKGPMGSEPDLSVRVIRKGYVR